MSNLNFRKVSNNGGFVSNLNVSDLNVSSLSVDSTRIVGAGNFNRVEYVGYVPTTFVGAAGTFSANVDKNGAAATVDTAVLIPTGAVIESVQLGNNGTTIVGGATFNVELHNVLNAAGGTSFLTATLLTTVNFPGAINANGSSSVLGVSLGAPLAADSYINITSSAPVTAGDARVVVVALVPKSI